MIRGDKDPKAELVGRVRRFVAEEVAPRAASIDRENAFPADLYRRMGQEGLLGLARPQGAGKTTLEWAVWIEELAAASATVADIVCSADLVALILDENGTEEQKSMIGPLLTGESVGAFALTEAQAGSNAAAIETTARREGDTYVLQGTKAWITCAQAADWAIVLAKTDPEAGTRGITAFLVERGSFTNGEGPYDTMGQRASDVAMKVTVEALQIHGASGYSRALPLERYVRDAKLTQIYEGTNQIQREVLARQLLE